MSQPGPPNTRQSKPPAKPADMDALHNLQPGGPILPRPQPADKPNPTDRGDEPNTRMHRGTPNPEQHGSHGPIGDYVHDPGMAQAGAVHGHGVTTMVLPRNERHSDIGVQSPPPEPDPMGVRKNCD